MENTMQEIMLYLMQCCCKLKLKEKRSYDKDWKNVLETIIKEQWKKWKIRNERNTVWASWSIKMTEINNVIIKDKKYIEI